MEKKTITVQTNTSKKGKLAQRSFTCQFYENIGSRIYALDDTVINLKEKRFPITPGCRVIDGGITYLIMDINYSPRPAHPYLIVDPNITV